MDLRKLILTVFHIPLAISLPQMQVPIGLAAGASSSMSTMFAGHSVQTVPHLADYAIHSREIAREDSICDPTVKEMSGYFETVNGYFFFTFFESRRDPENDPFLMWTNGGPGCSSNLGWLMELGPCRVAQGGNKTNFNPYGWNNQANLLFIDQPVGVGFSIPKKGRSVADSWSAGVDVDAFFQIFFHTHPQYSRAPFHVFGESYGGHYVPAIGKAIHVANIKGRDEEDPYRIHVNLRSVGIGNGIMSVKKQAKYFHDMACDTKYGPLTTPERCQQMHEATPTCEKLSEICDTYRTALTCYPALAYCERAMGIPNNTMNPYDVRVPCMDRENLCYPIVADISTFLNNPDIQERLGVSVPYVGCSSEVGMAFARTADHAMSFDDFLSDLLEDGVSVLVYAGDADYVCNWYSNLGLLEQLDWEGVEGFRNAADFPFLESDRGEAGSFRTFGNLTWVKVFDAGHMVPYDQPEVSETMIKMWLDGQSLIAN